MNVDFLVSGCNTHCKHCYVNGGPGPLMRTADALACIEKLDRIAAGVIQDLPGNTDYGAFYDIENLPSMENVLKAIKALPQSLVYGDFASILYRAFVSLDIPTKILSRI